MKQDPAHLAELFYDAFNRGAIEEACELFSDDCYFFEPLRGRIFNEQFHRNLAAYKTGMPDARIDIETVLVKGNTVAVEGFFTGTHTGPLVGPVMEFPATNRPLKINFAAFIESAGGKIVSYRSYFNQLEVANQLDLFNALGV